MDARRILSTGRVSPIDSDAVDLTASAVAATESEPESLDPLPENRSVILRRAEGAPGAHSSAPGSERCLDLRLSLKGRDVRCLVLDLNPEVLCESSSFFAEMVMDSRVAGVSAGWREIEVGDVEDLDVFRETIELMYEKDMMRQIMKGGVSLAIGNLELLAACTRASAFSEGTQLHAFLLKMGDTGGVAGDIFINNTLLYFYSERGEMDSEQQVFDGMTHRNVVSWTSLIDGHARGEYPRTAVSLFEDMVREGGVRPNVVTMACVVSACAKLRDLETGGRVHAFVVDSGVDVSVSLVNSFVDMYMKCGEVEVAERLFSECVDRNLVLWNTMMSNYARQGMAEKALGVLSEMLAFRVMPDRVSIIAAVSASAQLGEVARGKQLHGYVVRNGLDGWDAVRNSVIDMYMKCGEPGAAYRVFNGMMHKTSVSWNTILAGCIRKGDLDAAWRHFDLMPKRDLISWNTMIGGLVQNSCFEEAVVLFRALQGLGIKPDRVTMVSVASACGYLGALDLAKWIYTYIDKNGIPCDVKLGTALVDMFAKCGDSKISMQVFDKMQSKDVSTWTAAIGAMASEGNGKRALEIFGEMIMKGVKPDEVVFVGLLTACSHGGLVEEGWRFFRSMSKNYGLSPQVAHYGCMVDLLGRAGLLEEAQALIEGMPMEPNDVIWGALLAASRLHHDLSLAEYAAKKMIALAPERSGSHVLLSNTYAFDRKWLDVAKVRLSLKAKGIQKLPGSSLIEVDGTIHEFTSSNESHPHMAIIAEMLHEIGEKLAFAGHVSDLTNVLVDVDDNEKEHLLSRHSEKMAVAFGLVFTSQRMPIHIVKNLRICRDCHSFMKLVSAVYGREITIRDNYRFHHFQKGVCSCKDYW